MAGKIDDGGAAFARPMCATGPGDGHNIQDYGDDGMSLRDYFAAKALIPSLSHARNMWILGAGDKEGIEALADDCYAMADAMLKARKSIKIKLEPTSDISYDTDRPKPEGGE